MNTIQVTVRTSGGTDEWGDPQPASTRVLSDCVRWPRATTETRNRSDAVTSGWMLSAPDGSNIASTDQVQMPDDPSWWEVDGDVLPFETPFSDWRPGTPVALTRTKG